MSTIRSTAFVWLVIGGLLSTSAQAKAGIFGRRVQQGPRPTPAAQAAPAGQPTTAYRSNSYQPTQNPFPFNSRSNPRDWTEAHRGYGIKIRGW